RRQRRAGGEVLVVHAQARRDELSRSERPGSDQVRLGSGARPELAHVRVGSEHVPEALAERRTADAGPAGAAATAAARVLEMHAVAWDQGLPRPDDRRSAAPTQA